MISLRKMQALLAALLVLVFSPTLWELARTFEAGEKATLDATPLMTLEVLRAHMKRFEAEVHAQPTEPAQYFRTAALAFKAEKWLDKFVAVNPKAYHEFPDLRLLREYMRDILQLQDRYTAKFGKRAMQEAAPGMSVAFPYKTEVPSRVTEFLLTDYLCSVIIAMLFFVVSLKRKNMMVIVEIHKIIGAAIVWPLAIWKYPVNTRPLEQVKRVMRFVSYAFSSLLSLGGVGLAKAGPNEKDVEQDDQNLGTPGLVVDSKPRFNYLLGMSNRKVVDNGNVVHDGPFQSAGATMTFTSGVSMNISGSRRFSGSGTSDELDWTLAKLWKFDDRGSTIKLALAYYDIAPVWRSVGGDIISPSVRIDKVVADGVTAFVYVDQYFVTRDAAGKNGYVARAGMSRSFSLGSSVVANLATSLAHSRGPFGTETRTNGRFDGSVSVPLTKGVSLTGSLKTFVPFGGGGRSTESQFGVEVAFSF